MINAGILDGDLAIIDHYIPVKNNEIGAILLDDDATLKRVCYSKKNITLNPENPTHNPITKPAQEVTILGKYIGLVRHQHK